MKKTVSMCLALMLALALTVPVLAKAPEGIVPYGTVAADGGLVYDTSRGQYYLYGYGSGIAEFKAVSVILYTASGDYVYSASNTGSTPRVDAGAFIPFSLASGNYKLEVTVATKDTVNTGVVRYYSV